MAPQAIKENIAKADAEDAKAKLESCRRYRRTSVILSRIKKEPSGSFLIATKLKNGNLFDFTRLP